MFGRPIKKSGLKNEGGIESRLIATPAIGNGTYYFVVTGTDVLGNTEHRPLLSEENTVITVNPSCGDTVAPVVAITSPANAASSTDTTQTLRATTDENATCSF